MTKLMEDFNDVAWMILYNYPEQLSPKLATSRQGLFSALRRYIQVPENDRSGESWAITQVIKGQEMVGMDDESRAAMHLMIYWARAWETRDKGKTHLEVGDAFVMVTPDRNWIYLCNAETLAEVMHRRNEFTRPDGWLEILSVFGPNISTVTENDWARHKKATGPPFNEQNNKIVWTEALFQAQGMLQYWQESSSVHTTAEETKTFSLNVLSKAGFGKSYPFKARTELKDDRHSMTYKDSLSIILEHALIILLIGPKFLLRWKSFLPKSWAKVSQATVEFQAYMSEMLQEERQNIADGKPSAGNLMTSLIRAAEVEEKPSDGGKRQMVLSESEIFGNIFVFNFAGHDTISHTLAYALTLMAAHPEVQSWVSEEIRHVFPNDDTTAWDYDKFPQLQRCLAVLLETVRLYNPLVAFVKSTGNIPRTLTYKSHLLNLPPNTMVIPNLSAIHTYPKYWGNNSLEWNPQRWIQPAQTESSTALAETLWMPTKGSYLPWSDGPRGCPGKKFSQVEFVAALAVLFRSHKMEIIRNSTIETQKQAEARIQTVVDNSAMVLLFQMLKPEEAVVRWVSN